MFQSTYKFFTPQHNPIIIEIRYFSFVIFTVLFGVLCPSLDVYADHLENKFLLRFCYSCHITLCLFMLSMLHINQETVVIV